MRQRTFNCSPLFTCILMAWVHYIPSLSICFCENGNVRSADGTSTSICLVEGWPRYRKSFSGREAKRRKSHRMTSEFVVGRGEKRWAEVHSVFKHVQGLQARSWAAGAHTTCTFPAKRQNLWGPFRPSGSGFSTVLRSCVSASDHHAGTGLVPPFGFLVSRGWR